MRNGEIKNASLTICSPLGEKYTAKDFTYLDETGVYTLTYSAEFAGKTYSKEYKVSSIRTDKYFEGTGITETLNVMTNYYDGVTGVELKPTADKKTVTARYGQIVDLNDFSNQEAVLKLYSQHIIDGQLGPMPKIRLTDIYDSSNYVEVETGQNFDWWYGHFIAYYTVRVSSTVKTLVSQSFYSHNGLTMYGYKGASLHLFWLNDDQAFCIPY